MTEHPDTPSGIGPDIVVAGAARSATSFLGAALATHPSVDAGAIKEPNFFSSQWDRTPAWYDSLYQPRRPGLLRLDASVSYTYPQHPQALRRLLAVSPDVRFVYVVREPITRLVSHYQLMRYYTGRVDLGTLSEALRVKEMFLGASAYDRWLADFVDLVSRDRVIVIPFPLITKDTHRTLLTLCRAWGLEPMEAPTVHAFQNNIREFRHPLLGRLQRATHRSGIYPILRRVVGPKMLRGVRTRLTRATTLPPASEELVSLTDAQRVELRAAASAAERAVQRWLAAQDAALDVDWSSAWQHHVADSSPDILGSGSEPPA